MFGAELISLTLLLSLPVALPLSSSTRPFLPRPSHLSLSPHSTLHFPSQISDVMSINSPSEFVRPIYAGNAIATVNSSDDVKIFTVRAASWDAAAPGGEEGSVDSAAAEDVGKGAFQLSSLQWARAAS